jgi:tetratricopeptide (TPR) repeat protein
MFLQVALILSLVKTKTVEININLNKIAQKIVYTIFILIGTWLIIFPVRIYISDVFFERSKKLDGNNSIKAAFNAIDTFPAKNPFYYSDFAQSSAAYAANFEDEEAKKDFSQLAENYALISQSLSGNNFIILRRIINTYILLNDSQNTHKNTLLTLQQKLVALAPTDPQTYLTSAKIEVSVSDNQKAIEYLNQALELKPDYAEAQQLLEEIRSTINN